MVKRISLFFAVISLLSHNSFALGLTEDNLIMRTEFSRIIDFNENYYMYYNYGDGYLIKFPKKFTLNEALAEVKVTLESDDTLIDIYYDSFENGVENSDIYIGYSNRNITDNKYIKKEIDGYMFLKGYKVHLMRWKRKGLKGIQNDRNYYICSEIIKNPQEVYTILIRTKDLDFPYLEIIENFEIIPRISKTKNRMTFKSKSKNFNLKTQKLYQEILNSNRKEWGIFEPTAPTSMKYLKELERTLNKSFKYILKYEHLNSNLSLETLKNVSSDNKYLELTLQTTLFNEDFDPNITYKILNGEYDDFLNSYAKYVKDYKEPVLFRLNNEMNGDWCQYNGLYTNKDTELYKALWVYIYDIFQKNNVKNAIWVWNPNNRDFPNFKWNNYLNYYPGDEYVDVIGLTAYNTGSYYRGEKWEDFNSLYKPLYSEYMKVFDYPFIITEFGCNSIGGDKVAWIENMFHEIKKYENIKVLIWFNGTDYDSKGNPARIYRLDENNRIINVFRRMFAN